MSPQPRRWSAPKCRSLVASEKLETLREFLATLDISLPREGVLRPDGFNRILVRVRVTVSEPVMSVSVKPRPEHLVRDDGHSAQPAADADFPPSPIRRYADLVHPRSSSAMMPACRRDRGIARAQISNLAPRLRGRARNRPPLNRAFSR